MERINVIKISADAGEMGKTAALDVAGSIKKHLKKKGKLNMVFAAAPSQDTFLTSLSAMDIDWSKITCFHLDEYVDLPRSHPNTFEVYLNEHLFKKAKPKKVYFIKGMEGTPEEVCAQYGKLINENEIDIACIGIGENGHIAFNEPGSLINDEKIVRVITINEQSVHQQYDDYKNDPNKNKRYSSLDEVPRKAITLTIPTILAAKEIYVIVPGLQKAAAVKRMWEGPISEKCPSSALRFHSSVKIYLEENSASLLRKI